jgi:uncharacterized membrane protein (UPF0127 family)
VRHFLGPLLDRGGTVSALINARTGSVVASFLEGALDSTARRRGLLGRAGLAAGHALALAPCSAVHTCFMRFPIDVVFVSRDGRVVKIVEHLPAWRVAASLRAFAVIELPAGTLRRSGLARGDRVVVVPAAPREAHETTFPA